MEVVAYRRKDEVTAGQAQDALTTAHKQWAYELRMFQSDDGGTKKKKMNAEIGKIRRMAANDDPSNAVFAASHTQPQ